MIITEAILKAGGVQKLAKNIGVTYQAIQLWESRGKVPAERVLDLERVTGICRTEFRPDIYPAEDYKKAS